MKRITIGSPVRLKYRVCRKRKHRQATVVEGRIPGVKGGLILAEALEGSRGWNVKDLELYPGPWK